MADTTLDRTEERVCGAIRERIKAAGLWHIPGTDADSARTHRISPEPFALTAAQAEELHRLGGALLKFYGVVNDLYLRSGIGWVREYLDLGKGEEIVRHGLMNYQKRALPRVIRPDILITENGFSITELDSVPGGIGQLDCLQSSYAGEGFDMVGGARGMRDGFAAMIRDVAGRDDPTSAIVVSEESVDYLPEMTHLAKELRDSGLEAYTVRPGEVEFTEDGLFIGASSGRVRVDALYRFYELFDLMNVPKAELIAYAAKGKRVIVTPPYKHFFEEKLLLALLHHEALRGFWESALGDDYKLLRRTVAPTFVLDDSPVPPHARISGFDWRGGPIRDWGSIKDGTQKERRLLIKPSGFSPLAWGSRGVKIGHDMSQEHWAKAVDDALGAFHSSPHVLQPFQDAAAMGIRYWDESRAEVREAPSRVRLCPYYFVMGSEAKLGGVLATAVPHDKKLIHGMVDAVMAPCTAISES